MNSTRFATLALTLLAFTTSTVKAVPPEEINIAVSLDSTPAIGSEVEIGTEESIYVDVVLDTLGFTGITLLSLGVIFDSSQLVYDKSRSTTTDWLLYNEGKKGAYLTPAKTCDDTDGFGCSIWITTDNQVNVDFIAGDLVGGTKFATGTSEASPEVAIPGGLLATLVFDVAPGAVIGPASITLSITSPGNVLGTEGGGGGKYGAKLTGSGHFNIIAKKELPSEDTGTVDAPDTSTADAGSENDTAVEEDTATVTDTAVEEDTATVDDTETTTDIGEELPTVVEQDDTPADTSTSADVDENSDTGNQPDAGSTSGSPADVYDEEPAPGSSGGDSGGCSYSGTSTPPSHSGPFWLFALFVMIMMRNSRKRSETGSR